MQNTLIVPFSRQVMANGNIRREEPEVVASLVSYLAKPEAHFITGKSLLLSKETCSRYMQYI